MNNRLDKARDYINHHYNDLQTIADAIGAHTGDGSEQTRRNIDHLITYDSDLLTIAVKVIGNCKRSHTMRSRQPIG